MAIDRIEWLEHLATTNDMTWHIMKYHDLSWQIMKYHNIITYYDIFVIQTKQIIFVAENHDYVLFDSFWGPYGFLDSAASYAALD